MSALAAPTTPGYQQLTQANALSILGRRLGDPGFVYWSQAELRLYIAEALRTWQAYTGWYRQRATLNTVVGQAWYDLGNYNVTDANVLAAMLYHLLETQLSANAWTGTAQFNLAVCQGAIQNRLNKFLADSGAVVNRVLQESGDVTASGRVLIQPNIIDVRRAAWVGNGGGGGIPTFIQGSGTAAIGNSVSFTFENPNQATDLILVMVTRYSPTAGFGTFSMTDTQGNVYQPREDIECGTTAHNLIYTVASCKAGANTLTFADSIANDNTQWCVIGIAEYSNLGTTLTPEGSGISFTDLTCSMFLKLGGAVDIQFDYSNGFTDGVGTPPYNVASSSVFGNLDYAAIIRDSLTNGAPVFMEALVSGGGGGGDAIGPATVLWRVDEWELNAYLPSWQTPGTPMVFSQAVTPPASLQLAPVPASASVLELLTIQNGPHLDLTSGATVLGVPDDFAWGIKFGALADLLSADGVAQDEARAAYCEQRYQQCVQLAKTFPAVLQAMVAGVPVWIGSIWDLDAFITGWEAATAGTPNYAGLAGRNLLALSPPPSTVAVVTLDAVQNMPVPTSDADYLQVPGDVLPAIIDYAMHLASFKMGGQEFAQTQLQMANFLTAAGQYNARLRQLATYNDALRSSALKDYDQAPRLDTPLLTAYGPPGGKNG